ncbi:MAG: sugar phosphate isomerase/epimerase family protein [Planctomycetota bacterium]|nr:sugar phosphate isomerase/epimerase family protein [Planctomycetota bacterium]
MTRATANAAVNAAAKAAANAAFVPALPSTKGCPMTASRDRRQFLGSAALAAGAAALTSANRALAQRPPAPDLAAQPAPSPQSTPQRPLRIGVSTYSYWHFRGDKPDLLELIDRSASYGFDGVEILHQMMPTEDNAFCQQLKHRAFVNGISLMGFSIHQGFVTPDEAERQHNIDHTLKCIELAHEMGIPTLRLNTGRWRTIKSFDEFMANKGIEPALPGYTEDQAFEWTIRAIEKLLPLAEKRGLCMGLENHWGLGRTAAGVLRIHDAIKSPWLKITLDTGNFLEDMYPQMQAMAPHAVLVQAKTYFGGGEWYTLDIDYSRVNTILRDAGFKGWVSLEFEGKDPPEKGVPESLKLFRKSFA